MTHTLGPRRKILVKGDLHPEDNAMLQALYSRSPASVDDHLAKVEEVGSGKFMDQYYVKYGHASVGDGGSTTIYIEGVSMLMAKAIQDNPLYSGQEASTRYMDFKDAVAENPFQSLLGEEIQMRWMSFYHHAFERLLAHFRTANPQRDGESLVVYERALRARTFDVCRAFLPAGTRTQLSWHTNLRQGRDKVRWLMFHPDPAMRALALVLLEKLNKEYPHSGFHFEQMSDEEKAWRQLAMDECYVDDESPFYGLVLDLSGINYGEFRDHNVQKMLATRPPKVGLPHFLARLGTVKSEFLLDFGSFRDLQRHRNGYNQMPLLTTRHGFHGWYLDQMPSDLRAEAEVLIHEQMTRIRSLPSDHVLRQYYVAMGFRVRCKLVQNVPAFVYRVELRSNPSVHPTLRQVAQSEGKRFFDLMNGMVVVHLDVSKDTWDLRRGDQTITAR